MAYHTGRHFLQIPGPSNVPDRILHAMAKPTIDHRGPDFQKLGQETLTRVREVFRTTNPVIIYPASGTGAWEAALVNVLEPGDKVLMVETGHFATLWDEMARKLGFDPLFLETNWRHGVDPTLLENFLNEDKSHSIKAVCVVHNETSTGVTSRIGEVRRAIDNANHPALLLVDTISGLGSMDYRHDDWGVDVTVTGSQKGLMLPPGISFNAVSDKALAAARANKYPRSFWDWEAMLGPNAKGFFPYTPNSNLLAGLKEALHMILDEEGLDNVLARHARHGEACRRAVQAWGLEIVCENPAEFSNVLTGVMMPGGTGADALRSVILENFDVSLGAGLGKFTDKIFRIGHLGNFNDPMLMGTLSAVEMGLQIQQISLKGSGVGEAQAYLADTAAPPQTLIDA